MSAHRTSILKGAALTVTMRWTDRLIGIASTLILARLLVPADFGIIAMASLVVGLLDILLDLGVNVALIQNRNAEPAHYNTAWTLRLLQTLFSALLIVVSAPLAGDYFNDQRVVIVLQVMSIGLVLMGLENIGVVNFQKHMQFGLDFRFMFLKRIAGFFATIIAAWLLRSYWALVIGTLVSRLAGVLLSYLLHPMRPRFSFEKFGEIFGISQWMLINSIGRYLDNNLHKILVGRRSGTVIMGGYNLADEISAMPSGELLAPLNRVLFPAFVAVRDNLDELKRLFLLTQGIQTLIGIPVAVGLAMVSREAVLLLLGEKWMLAVPFVQLLALVNAAQAITTSGGYVMLTLGLIRYSALLVWLRVVLFIVMGYLILPTADAMDIAALRLLIILSCLALSLWLVTRHLKNVHIKEIAATITRPLLGASAMGVVLYFGAALISLPLIVTLLIKIVAGIVTYVSSVMFMWWISGKPAGTETYLIQKVSTTITGLRKRKTESNKKNT